MISIKALPPLILFRRTAQRTAIEKDMLRWLQFIKPERKLNSPKEVLMWLLESHPEFRNLYFARIGRYSSLAGKALVFLARWLYPPTETPGFAEPLNIGPGLFIFKGFGCVIGPEKMGENCWIGPGVTFGYKGAGSGLPSIGNNVFIGAGAKILGSLTVGDNAVIGANAVVVKDVPANCTVVGVPARIIKQNGVKVGKAGI